MGLQTLTALDWSQWNTKCVKEIQDYTNITSKTKIYCLCLWRGRWHIWRIVSLFTGGRPADIVTSEIGRYQTNLYYPHTVHYLELIEIVFSLNWPDPQNVWFSMLDNFPNIWDKNMNLFLWVHKFISQIVVIKFFSIQ